VSKHSDNNNNNKQLLTASQFILKKLIKMTKKLKCLDTNATVSKN